MGIPELPNLKDMLCCYTLYELETEVIVSSWMHIILKSEIVDIVSNDENSLVFITI